jgi:hypothetical protein
MLTIKNNEMTRAVKSIKSAFCRLYKEPVFITLFVVFALSSGLSNLIYLILLWLFLICACYGIGEFMRKDGQESTSNTGHNDGSHQDKAQDTDNKIDSSSDDTTKSQ